MNRSFVNKKLRETFLFFKENNFHLPPWAYWDNETWEHNVQSTHSIRGGGLGWDLTDFSFTDFDTKGLTLFTLRNGLYQPDKKPYCEKIMHVRKDQLTPYHYHADKIEDIIVRGGKGTFCLALLPTDEQRMPLYDAVVVVEIDGMERIFKAEEKITLQLGQSITLQPYLYHKFWAEGDDCLIGEVSTINNDAVDNYFLESLGRYAEIVEDEAAEYVLCNEYPQS